jgi:hypothetical protein
MLNFKKRSTRWVQYLLKVQNGVEKGESPCLIDEWQMPPVLWDTKTNRAKGKGTEAQKIDHALDKIKAKIIEHYGQNRKREWYT